MPLRFVYIAYFALLFCNVPHHNIILQTSAIIPLSTHKRMLYTTVSLCCIWGRFGTVKAGARRWNCHEIRGVLHEGAPLSLSSPRLPYHAIIVLSTAYQWMAGAIHCVYDIRGWLGAANAGAWCHNGHDTTVNHAMIIWRCNFLDRDPSMMVHTIDTNGLLPTNEDHSPLPIHVGNKVYMIWR